MGLRKARLLIVDDQPGVRSLVRLVFEGEDLEIHTASNGLEAVNKAAALVPNLVIMDVRMPVMDGIKALALMKEKNRELPVIMMTAYMDAEMAQKARQAGASLCLVKPFDVEELKKAALQLLFPCQPNAVAN